MRSLTTTQVLSTHLRHTGPSEDALEGYRALKDIRVRGRWRGKASLLRYAKKHSLLAAKARVPVRVKQLGEKRMRPLGERAAKAIMSTKIFMTEPPSKCN